MVLAREGEDGLRKHEPAALCGSRLGSVYTALEVYSWPLVRAATGFFFLPHGMQKLFGFWGGDIAKTAEGFAKQGLHPALFWAYYIGCLEFFGGICLILAC